MAISHKPNLVLSGNGSSISSRPMGLLFSISNTSGDAVDRRLKVITGEGRHSPGNVAKLKRAVNDYLKEQGYRYDLSTVMKATTDIV